MLTLYVTVSVATHLAVERLREHRDDKGQASAEYALVLLGAAAVALLVTAWAAKTNRVGRLLDAVFERILGRVR